MRKAIVALAVLPAIACFGCSKPKSKPDAIDDFAKELKNTPKPNLAASDELYQKLKLQDAAAAAATPAGPLIGSQEEFTALVQKAGYAPHPADPGRMPYFEALPRDEAARHGLPDALEIIYTLSDDKKSLIFLALVRPLEASEEGDMQNKMSQDPVFAAETVAKLNSANPDPKYALFGAHLINTGMAGSAVISRPMLLLEVAYANDSANADVVKSAVVETQVVLAKTQAIWK